LSEIELSEYCRKKGLYLEQVKSWKDVCLQANGGVGSFKTEYRTESKESEYKKLEKELRRK